MPKKIGKYINPTVDDYLEMARKRIVQSDGDSRAICMLADEVIKLRNAMPCSRCLGAYDTCTACKKHKGKEFKHTVRLFSKTWAK